MDRSPVSGGLGRDSTEGELKHECAPDGGPADPVTRSWWEAGFRVVGYPDPPAGAFEAFIAQLRRRPWGNRMRVKGWTPRRAA